MKKIKIIIVIIIMVLICYIMYVTTDSIRLRNSKIGTKPIITIDEMNTKNKLIYFGLGYSIAYYKDVNISEENDTTFIEQLGYGAEFRLFNKIFIWAWVE